MNVALVLTQAEREIQPFIAVGRHVCDYSNLSLNYMRWEKLLHELERAIEDPTMLLPAEKLSPKAQLMVLEHYHRVYKVAASLVPLSVCQWKQWEHGLLRLCSSSGAQSLPNENEAPTVAFGTIASVEAKRLSFLKERDDLFIVNYWGTSWSTKVGLKQMMEACHAQDSSDKDADDSVRAIALVNVKKGRHGASVKDTFTEFVQAHFKLLHGFNRLRCQSEHLYNDYSKIGIAERAWLLDGLLAHNDGKNDGYEVAVESVVRQTFKWDLGVASAALADGSLLEEYHEFEVNETKQHELDAVQHATLCSGVYRASQGFGLYEAAVALREEHADLKPCDHLENRMEALPLQLEGHGSALADELLEAFLKDCGTKGGREASPRRAFAFTLRRFLELEPFPGTLNPSRLEFCLHLFHHWVFAYYRRSHRGTPQDLFFLPDDADLWKFILERHDVLLRWALASFQDTTQTPTSAAGPRCATTFEAQLETLRVVAWSLVHIWQDYVSVIHHHHKANDSRCVALERTAKEQLSHWITTQFISLFCKALFNDLYIHWEYADDSGEASKERMALPLISEGVFETPELSSKVLLLVRESELKLLICDVQKSVQGAVASVQRETRHRLLPLLEEILPLCAEESQEELSKKDFCTLCYTAARILARLQVCSEEYITSNANDTSKSSDKLFVVTMHRYYKTLMRQIPRADDHFLLNVVSDGWTQLLTLRQLDNAAVLSFYGAHGGAGSGSSNSAGNGLIDLCYERRRACKKLLKKAGENRSNSACEENRSSGANVVDNRKRPR